MLGLSHGRSYQHLYHPSDSPRQYGDPSLVAWLHKHENESDIFEVGICMEMDFKDTRILNVVHFLCTNIRLLVLKIDEHVIAIVSRMV